MDCVYVGMWSIVGLWGEKEFIDDTGMMGVRNLLSWRQQTMGGLDYLLKQPPRKILGIQIN